MRGTVVGLGTMGPGIAATLARGGMDVICYDLSAEQVRKAESELPGVRAVLDRIGGPAGAKPGEVGFSTDFTRSVQSAEFVIEAVPEIVQIRANPIVVSADGAILTDIALMVAPFDQEPLPPLRRLE